MLNSSDNKRQLSPFISPVMAPAFAVGTSIGWGSLVVTSNTYLMKAGPVGSVLGLREHTHSSKKFDFKKDRLFRILSASVIITTALYIFVTLLSVTACPPEDRGILRRT